MNKDVAWYSTGLLSLYKVRQGRVNRRGRHYLSSLPSWSLYEFGGEGKCYKQNQSVCSNLSPKEIHPENTESLLQATEVWLLLQKGMWAERASPRLQSTATHVLLGLVGTPGFQAGSPQARPRPTPRMVVSRERGAQLEAERDAPSLGHVSRLQPRFLEKRSEAVGGAGGRHSGPGAPAGDRDPGREGRGLWEGAGLSVPRRRFRRPRASPTPACHILR